MTRETKADLQKLQEFINGYTLTGLSKQKDFGAILPKLHSSYLALLIFSAELDEHCNKINSQFSEIPLPSPKEKEYLDESISDIGQSLFCWIHGCYKGARVLLRSSIETFSKGLCCASDPQVLTLKRVHDVFEVCSKSIPVSSEPNSSIFDELVQKYGDLCVYVHTASSETMDSVSSISHFPAFKKSDAKATADSMVYVTSRMLVIMSVRFNGVFHYMHHRNRESVVDCLIPSYLKRIQNIE
jgi:hypothetical protein